MEYPYFATSFGLKAVLRDLFRVEDIPAIMGSTLWNGSRARAGLRGFRLAVARSVHEALVILTKWDALRPEYRVTEEESDPYAEYYAEAA
jgi:hypothetical protein